MTRESIKQILIRRDNMTANEADSLIEEAKKDFFERIERDDFSAEDICEEYFGLEPDYLDEFIF
jgi:hypothetical protein